MKPENFKEIFPVNVVSVQGKPYLMSDLRVDRDTIPAGLYAYDVRDNCDGCFWEVQDDVSVNFWACIIGKEKIEYPDGKSYVCPPEDIDPSLSSEGFYIDYDIESLDEYLDGYDELSEMAK